MSLPKEGRKFYENLMFLLLSWWAFLVARIVKHLPAMRETRGPSLGQEDPLEMQPTPVLLTGEFHGRRSLVGYSPWGC